MAIKSAPPESDLPNIRKLRRAPRPLWRLFAWGSAAAIALAALAITSQTEAGRQRLQLALAYASEPVRVVMQVPPRASRDRGRIDAWPPTSARVGRRPIESTKRHATGDPGGRYPAGGAERARHHARVIAIAPPLAPALPARTPLAMPAPTEAAASWSATTTTREAAEPLPEPIPLPPLRVAAVQAAKPRSRRHELKPEFGIDLGGAANLEALRVRLGGEGRLRTAVGGAAPGRFAAPAPSGRRRLSPGDGTAADVAAAARLCARMPVTRTGCRPAKSTARIWPSIDCGRAGAPA